MVRVKRFHGGACRCATPRSSEQQHALLSCCMQMLDPVRQCLRDLRRMQELLVLEYFPVPACLRSRVTMLAKLWLFQPCYLRANLCNTTCHPCEGGWAICRCAN